MTGNRRYSVQLSTPPSLILHARHGELLVVWLICLGRLAGCPITLPVILIGEGYRRTGPCRGNRPHDLQLSGVRRLVPARCSQFHSDIRLSATGDWAFGFTTIVGKVVCHTSCTRRAKFRTGAGVDMDYSDDERHR